MWKLILLRFRHFIYPGWFCDFIGNSLNNKLNLFSNRHGFSSYLIIVSCLALKSSCLHICGTRILITAEWRRRQAFIWTNAGILLIGHLGSNFNGISIEICTLSLRKIHLKCRKENGEQIVSVSMYQRNELLSRDPLRGYFAHFVIVLVVFGASNMAFLFENICLFSVLCISILQRSDTHLSYTSMFLQR